MPFIYSDPARKDDPHALPDVEAFQFDPETDMQPGHPSTGNCDGCDAAITEGWDDPQGEAPGLICRECAAKRQPKGWYWWSCFPGCLPDSPPSGPYANQAEAESNAIATQLGW